MNAAFNDPAQWLRRIEAYTGIMDQLSQSHTIISIEQINYKGFLQQNNVQYIFPGYKKRPGYFQYRLHKLIRSLHPDVVVVHGLSFPLPLIQLKAYLGEQVKIIAQHHAEKPFNTYSILQKIADKFIHAYLFTSVEMGRDWMDKGIIKSEKKIWPVMEASSVFKLQNRNVALQHTGAKGKPVYLFVGRLDENKDPVTVVKAFIQFSKQNPGACLYMIYHTTDLLPELQQILATEANKNAVVLVGKIDHHEMEYWFNSADFIISGSHYEGSGVAVCEGMSCGCIPVLTAIPAFNKLTSNGSCGLLYEKGNMESLLSALIQTQSLDITAERKKVLTQFNEALSFTAIAKQINEQLILLCGDAE